MVVLISEDRVVKENLKVLLHRERGSKLIVCDDGSICSMSISERIRYCFNETFRKEVQSHLKKSIKGLIERVHFNHRVKDQAEATTTLFFQRLNFLSEAVYDRASITRNTILYKFLLSRMNVEAVESDFQTDPDFVEKVKRAKLSQALGIKPKSGGGCSGSYIIREIAPTEESEYIGIFKPKNEESASITSKRIMTSLKNIIASLIFFWGSRNQSSQGTSYLAEEGAYRVSEAIGLRIVPRTTSKMNAVVRFGEKPALGSFQEFIKGCVPATDKLKVTKSFKKGSEKIKKSDAKGIEKFIIFSFIIGNSDAHAENCLFKRDGEVVAIDGGLAFPVAQPIAFRELRYYNRAPGLRSLKGKKFSRGSLEIICLAHSRKGQLNQILRDLYQNTEVPRKIEERIKAMNERIDLLYTNFYEQKKDISELRKAKAKVVIKVVLTI